MPFGQSEVFGHRDHRDRRAGSLTQQKNDDEGKKALRWTRGARADCGMQKEEQDPLTNRIIGAAIEVHRHLGPGVLESVFEECLCYEIASAKLSVRRQAPVPVIYKDIRLEMGFRADLIVDEKVIVELKCVEKMLPIHDAQLLTYLKLSGFHIGLLINFFSQPLWTGIKRMVN